MVETMNKTYSEIKEYFNSSYDEDTMREMLRNYFSRNPNGPQTKTTLPNVILH